MFCNNAGNTDWYIAILCLNDCRTCLYEWLKQYSGSELRTNLENSVDITGDTPLANFTARGARIIIRHITD
ncbi:hypothetical protein RclHR1_30330003 [Rhizophagus clarus]|uniref:Uncharacterized protein n=1 Tax=Rhizophagus clarus TaxID=94130 RepID=A0A2Z6RHW5_9GLOM|nr:hypothetical protein RclHR1_30330003 [Rhizophagus clarus]